MNIIYEVNDILDTKITDTYLKKIINTKIFNIITLNEYDEVI